MRIPALLEASVMLARSHTEGEVLTCIDTSLPKLADASAYHVVRWGASGERLLRSHGSALSRPSSVGRTQLAEGNIVVENEVSYIPLVARGKLQGWIGIASNETVDAALAMWGAQCAAALLSIEAVVERRERAAIDEIAQVLSNTLDLETVLQRIAQTTGELIEADSFFIALLEDDRRHLRFAYINLPEGSPLPDARWSVDEGLTGIVIKTGEIICTDDYLAECARRGIMPQDPAGLSFSKAWLGVPLRHQDQTLGVIFVTHDEEDVRFGQADVQLLSTIAAHAAAAVANAQLYGQTDEALAQHVRDLEARNRQLGEVVKIGNALRSTFSLQTLVEQITHAIQVLTGTPRAILGLVEAERPYLRIASAVGLPEIAPASDMGQWVTLDQLERLVSRAQPIGTFTFHVGHDPLLPWFDDALLMVIREPRGTLVGAIALDIGERGAPLPAQTVGTLEIVGNQAGIALNNAVLYAEQQQTVDRLTALNALSLAVSTAQLSVEDVVNMAVAGAVGTTGGLSGGAIVALEGRPITTYGARLPAGVEVLDLATAQATDRDYVQLDSNHLPASFDHKGIRHLLALPLRGAQLRLGSLWIAYEQSNLTQAEREMAVLYAKMAGAVIENLYLAEAVRSAHDRMASILGSTREGMLLVGADRRVAMTNRAFAQLTGLQSSRLESRDIEEVCAGDEMRYLPDDVREAVCAGLTGVLAGSAPSAEGDVHIPGGPERDLTWQVWPVRAASSDTNGALLVVRDVTADRQMERFRQDLSNMIVHDLRSPLTNMMVSVDLLLKRSTGPLTDAQARILGIASNSCQQMLDLVNALLDIRRLEQRTRELQRRPIDLPVMAETVVERLERTAEDRRVKLENYVTTTVPVEADEDMIRRVLQNLVDNAIKFSPPGGTVTLRSSAGVGLDLPPDHPAGEWVVVAVEDQGIGIAEEYHRAIFDLFVQTPDGQGRGTGLGLAFCKLAVEAHGGHIWLRSAPGEGATFYFSLPASRNVEL
jgi:PAS domain S-box-containing protein